ncbi:Tripeptidyl-peptidase SED2 [Lachnellula arida]|uniref:tripeptidyl-peptidase II n=1 Tax=Lachnellula arida TaxID=1316785 RepID=A0A8T9BK13_9HELO|nr:Tripeptidyl-peptidase SED2 [Lachnellula arida]
MMGLVILALTLMSSLSETNASPLSIRSAYLVKDSHPIPFGWEKVRRAPAEEIIHLQIGLNHGRFDELERHLYQVSDPSHRRYGKHLSSAEIDELVKPAKETTDQVREWLSDFGIHELRYSPAQDWINVHLPVHVAESLLDTQYHIYRHAEDGSTVLRAAQWSLPRHLHDHIDAVHPTNAFLRTRQQSKRVMKRSLVSPTGLEDDGLPTYKELEKIDRTEMGHMEVPNIKDMPSNPSPLQACNGLATSPLCLRTLYGTLDYAPQLTGNNRIGIVNYLDQINNQSDIEIFLGKYRSDAVGAASQINTVLIANGSNQQTPITQEQIAQSGTIGLEGNLNAETVIGLAYPIPVTTYNIGGRAPFQNSKFTTHNQNEPYLEWLQYVLAQPDLPQVITTSYADEEQTVPYWYARRACQGFAQLGARGVSVLFASGDEGVGADGMCFSNDNSSKPMFLPTFPASCPYVTTVGATRGLSQEIVAFDARTDFIAGGGFSNYFPRPAYQKEATDGYVAGLGDMHDGLYNKNGRGYPDISVRGYHYITVYNGTSHIIDGTSASSPAAAAFFSLINDALVAEGKPVLGWLNPWLYSGGLKGLTDVSAGSNPGCNTAGFPAKEGWDAATGLGTPWFPMLKSLALEYQYRETRPWYMRPFDK